MTDENKQFIKTRDDFLCFTQWGAGILQLVLNDNFENQTACINALYGLKALMECVI